MKTHVARVNKPVIAACYLTQICKGINSRALYDCFIGNFVTNWYFLSAEIDRKKDLRSTSASAWSLRTFTFRQVLTMLHEFQNSSKHVYYLMYHCDFTRFRFVIFWYLPLCRLLKQKNFVIKVTFSRFKVTENEPLTRNINKQFTDIISTASFSDLLY